jgi:hypothetical protein
VEEVSKEKQPSLFEGFDVFNSRWWEGWRCWKWEGNDRSSAISSSQTCKDRSDSSDLSRVRVCAAGARTRAKWIERASEVRISFFVGRSFECECDCFFCSNKNTLFRFTLLTCIPRLRLSVFHCALHLSANGLEDFGSLLFHKAQAQLSSVEQRDYLGT